jgi:hypothetical protein
VPPYRSLLGDFANAEAEARYVEIMRRMTPEQKWAMAFELWELAVEATRAGVRTQHPDWSEAQVQAEVARRILEANGGAARLPLARA